MKALLEERPSDQSVSCGWRRRATAGLSERTHFTALKSLCEVKLFLHLAGILFEWWDFFFKKYFFVHSCELVTMRVRYFLTLTTGLLECLCFCGVLFGWNSLVFTPKTESFFSLQCVNATDNAVDDLQSQFFLIIILFLLLLLF